MNAWQLAGRRARAAAWLFAVFSAGCTAKVTSEGSASHDSGPGAGGTVGAGGPDGAVRSVIAEDGTLKRTKRGVPIGDCVEPSPAAPGPAGCPPTEPTPDTACIGEVTCHYKIQIDAERADQAIVSCSGRPASWRTRVLEPCGVACGTTTGQSLDFDTADCASRPPSECYRGEGPYAWPPTAYTFTKVNLTQVALDCLADLPDDVLEMTLDRGCPARLTSAQPLTATAIDCIRKLLAGARYGCAETVPCVQRAPLPL